MNRKRRRKNARVRLRKMRRAAERAILLLSDPPYDIPVFSWRADKNIAAGAVVVGTPGGGVAPARNTNGRVLGVAMHGAEVGHQVLIDQRGGA